MSRRDWTDDLWAFTGGFIACAALLQMVSYGCASAHAAPRAVMVATFSRDARLPYMTTRVLTIYTQTRDTVRVDYWVFPQPVAPRPEPFDPMGWPR